jgi:FTR1 family protein
MKIIFKNIPKHIIAISIMLISKPILLSAKNQDLIKIFMSSSYIGSDYEKAVENGKVISKFEYEEMKNMCKEIQDSAKNYEEIKKMADELCQAIENKEDKMVVREISREISEFAVKKGAVQPTSAPSFKKGESLYKKLCSSCHGEKGEGYKITFENSPPPSPLTAQHISPAKVFAITKFGIEGTNMPKFELTDKERWSLSFYVSAMRYIFLEGDEKNFSQPDENRREITKNIDNFSALFDFSSKENGEIEKSYGFDTAKRIRLEVFRINNEDVFLEGLEKGIRSLKEGDLKSAEYFITSGYMIFEEIEPILSAKDKSKVKKIEMLYSSAIQDIKSGKEENAEEKIKKISNLLHEISENKTNNKFSAFIIVLREGFEAILIISAIFGIISSSGLSPVPLYSGALTGFISGVALWKVLEKIMSINRELMEGIMTALAVILILWVSLWVLQKTREENIRAFLEKIKKEAQTRNYVFLFLASFFAVSREAGETVIFLSALGPNIKEGVILGILALVAIAIIIYILKVKLKPKSFFTVTNVILNITAVALIGKAVLEFQSARIIPVDIIDFLPSIDILGIYPTVQTISAQLVLLVFIISITAYYLMKSEQR